MKGGVFLQHGEYNCLVQEGSTVFRIMFNNITNEEWFEKQTRLRELLPERDRFVLSDHFQNLSLAELNEIYPSVHRDFLECSEKAGFRLPERIILSQMPVLYPVKEAIPNTPSGTQWLEGSLRMMHKRGVVHLDIHPGNIMQTKNGHYVLIDWDSSLIFKEHDADLIGWIAIDNGKLNETFYELRHGNVKKHQSRSRERAESRKIYGGPPPKFNYDD